MINLEDYLNPNKGARNSALYGQFGMDPKGNNEMGAWARRFGQGLGLGLTRQVANWQQNTVPWAINTSNYLQSWLSPGTRSARTQQQAGLIQSQGRRAGDIASQQALGRGMTQDQALALRAAAEGRAQEAANSYLANDLSRLALEQSQLAPLIMELGGLSGLPAFLQTGGFIEGRSAQNAADRARGGLGGLLGQIGGLYGMGAFKAPVRTGGSGSGSDASSGTGQSQVGKSYSVIWGDM